MHFREPGPILGIGLTKRKQKRLQLDGKDSHPEDNSGIGFYESKEKRDLISLWAESIWGGGAF